MLKVCVCASHHFHLLSRNQPATRRSGRVREAKANTFLCRMITVKYESATQLTINIPYLPTLPSRLPLSLSDTIQIFFLKGFTHTPFLYTLWVSFVPLRSKSYLISY